MISKNERMLLTGVPRNKLVDSPDFTIVDQCIKCMDYGIKCMDYVKMFFDLFHVFFLVQGYVHIKHGRCLVF